jgi:hypothetical protein
MPPGERRRSKLGRFKRKLKTSQQHRVKAKNHVEVDHNYTSAHYCNDIEGCDICCPGIDELRAATKINTSKHKLAGRRIVEFEALIQGLSSCSKCFCGPLYLSTETVKGELKVGLAGYILSSVHIVVIPTKFRMERSRLKFQGRGVCPVFL